MSYNQSGSLHLTLLFYYYVRAHLITAKALLAHRKKCCFLVRKCLETFSKHLNSAIYPGKLNFKEM